MIPQSVDPADPTPHPPPLMLVSQFPANLLAPTLTLIRQGSADAAQSPPCHCELQFQGVAVQADPDLRLLARWFVDYDVNVPSSQRAVNEEILEPLNDEPKSLTRLLNCQLKGGLCSEDGFFFDANAVPIVQSGTHVLEVVVGELNGFDTSNSVPRPFRTMKPGYLTAEYRFVLNVTLEQVPGQCPRTPPSVCR